MLTTPTGSEMAPCDTKDPALAARAVLIGDPRLFSDWMLASTAGHNRKGTGSRINVVVVSLSQPEDALLERASLPACFQDRDWQHLPLPDDGFPDIRWEFEWMALIGHFLQRPATSPYFVLFDCPKQLQSARFAAHRFMLDVTAGESLPPRVWAELETYQLPTKQRDLLKDYETLLAYAKEKPQSTLLAGNKCSNTCGVFEKRNAPESHLGFAMTAGRASRSPEISTLDSRGMSDQVPWTKMEIQDHLLDHDQYQLEDRWNGLPMNFLFAVGKDGKVIARPLKFVAEGALSDGWQRDSLTLPLLLS